MKILDSEKPGFILRWSGYVYKSEAFAVTGHIDTFLPNGWCNIVAKQNHNLQAKQTRTSNAINKNGSAINIASVQSP